MSRIFKDKYDNFFKKFILQGAKKNPDYYITNWCKNYVPKNEDLLIQRLPTTEYNAFKSDNFKELLLKLQSLRNAKQASKTRYLNALKLLDSLTAICGELEEG